MAQAPTRRSLTGGTLLAMMGGAAGRAASCGDDAKLVALAREAAPLIDQYAGLQVAYWNASSADDSASDAIADRMSPIHDRLMDLEDEALELKSTTLEGHQAKAALLVHGFQLEFQEKDGMDFTFSTAELAWSLICDLTGLSMGKLAHGASLLACAGTAAPTAARAPSAEADIVLIRLCTEHSTLERELRALTKVSTIEAEKKIEAQAARIRERQLRSADQIGACPPTTPAGWRALAGTIAFTFPEMVRDQQGGHDSLLVATLLEGLLGRGAAADTL